MLQMHMQPLCIRPEMPSPACILPAKSYADTAPFEPMHALRVLVETVPLFNVVRPQISIKRQGVLDVIAPSTTIHSPNALQLGMGRRSRRTLVFACDAFDGILAFWREEVAVFE